jgi:hypothetical protein
MDKGIIMPKWVWWVNGACVVEVLGLGHFPTTIKVRLPDDKVTEVDSDQLELTKGRK